MDTELLYTLLFILLIPLIPSMLLYKFLPSKTAVGGPFKGLNIKLSGAFSGYFLLVLIAISISIMVSKDQNKRLREQLNELEEANSNYQDWEISGKVDVENPPLTTIFSNIDKAQPDNSGLFQTKVLLEKNRNKLNMLCFYHQSGRYKIVNLNKEFPPDDIASYGINIDTANRKIKINKTIAIDKGYLAPASQ